MLVDILVLAEEAEQRLRALRRREPRQGAGLDRRVISPDQHVTVLRDDGRAQHARQRRQHVLPGELGDLVGRRAVQHGLDHVAAVVELVAHQIMRLKSHGRVSASLSRTVEQVRAAQPAVGVGAVLDGGVLGCAGAASVVDQLQNLAHFLTDAQVALEDRGARRLVERDLAVLARQHLNDLGCHLTDPLLDAGELLRAGNRAACRGI